MNNVKKSIGWADYTINPVKGFCPMPCSYCYAHRLYNRFNWNKNITFQPDAFQPLMKIKEPSRIFVGSTMELFGSWILRSWMMDIFSLCNSFKQHTFIFLTKNPQNLIKWSPFPDNVWVGISVTHWRELSYALGYLNEIKAPVKFISFEPLLEQIPMELLYLLRSNVSWVIIGAQTPYSIETAPKYEWVKDIIELCAVSDIPYFLKNNLEKVIPKKSYVDGNLVQNFPTK